MQTEYFSFQSGFTGEKASFGKASFPILSVKSWKRLGSLLTTTKSPCDTCFSAKLCGPTGIAETEEAVSDVRLSVHTSPLPCHCSREKICPHFCGLFVLVAGRSQCQPGNLGSAKQRNSWGFSLVFFQLAGFLRVGWRMFCFLHPHSVCKQRN